jgi:hypothetical protein
LFPDRRPGQNLKRSDVFLLFSTTLPPGGHTFAGSGVWGVWEVGESAKKGNSKEERKGGSEPAQPSIP